MQYWASTIALTLYVKHAFGHFLRVYRYEVDDCHGLGQNEVDPDCHARSKTVNKYLIWNAAPTLL
jgi:hypothetical protein